MRAFMSPVFRVALLATVLSAAAQIPNPAPSKREEHPKLPDGRSQNEEILKADHKQNLKDAEELIKLAEDLKAELEKNDRHVLSLGLVKKTEDIEKLSKRIRSRMKRY